MEGKMNISKTYSYSIFLSGLLLIVLLSSSITKDGFEKVLAKFSNDSIKTRLIKFEKKGIEHPVDTSNYNIPDLIEYSKSFLGTKHMMGGSSKKGIDCSGLVMVAHKKFGISLPHNSEEQARFGRIVAEEDSLHVGDLVFFYNSYKTKEFITHSGIYVGEGNFIHTSFSTGVVITNLKSSAYWRTRFLFGTRFKS